MKVDIISGKNSSKKHYEKSLKVSPIRCKFDEIIN